MVEKERPTAAPTSRRAQRGGVVDPRKETNLATFDLFL